jgi:hypothetical protein
MTGDADGPATAPGDLRANTSFDMGNGCGKFDYGYSRGTNAVATPGVTPEGQASSVNPKCKATASAYRRARVRRARRGARFDIATRTGARFRVDVFQVSTGRRVIGRRLVARFRNARRAFTWNGRGQGRRRVRDGYFIARVSAAGQVRRFVLRRARGRISVRGAYDRRTQCSLVRTFRASLPAFGGRLGRPVTVSYLVDARATVSISILRGKKVVRRIGTRTRDANHTYRQRLTALRLPRGDLRIVLNAKAGNRTQTSKITVRRL